MRAPRIALIHAVQVAMRPVEDVFARHWPQAERMNILDDALSADRERDAVLTEAMAARVAQLASYARAAGADAILYTCSAFGEAIARVQRAMPIPVLRPNEAMFREALEHGALLGMLATFTPSVASMEEELRALSGSASVRTICIPRAMAALKAGDGAMHDRLLAEAAPQLADCDALMLAHFSTARAREAVAATVRCAVLTAPDSAVLTLKRALSAAATPAPSAAR